MDVLSSVYSLTVGIVKFISEHENKDNITSQISNTSATIQRVIEPLLKHRTTDPTLQLTIQGLQANLQLTSNHLLEWSERRSKRIHALLIPWAATQELQSDLDQLMRQYILLLGALQAIQFRRSYTFWYPTTHKAPGAVIYQADYVWQKFLGKELDFCRSEEFVTGISRYLRRGLTPTEHQRLLLKFDMTNTGYVFRGSFNTLVGKAKVSEVISYYTSDPPLPLLIWVDDNLENNTWAVDGAFKNGVTVVQLRSTESAKRWIRVNKEFLRKNDHAASIRYITDQVRTEPDKDGVTFTNLHAGAQFISFIRSKKKLKAPVLVFTALSRMSLTEYVKSLRRTGSTASCRVIQLYISQLGARMGDTPPLTYNTM
ncbi:hypothetical protein BJ165DRAFT_421 [Panaeolus papilionaceus]|nr:hypothetical protein BJ165DRAFT_421 [Panaeolus papilionaceus]